MNALKLLTADHDVVRDLFEQFRQAKETGAEADMRRLRDEIFDELTTHTRIEEEIFYPAVRDLGVEEISETVAESLQEHHVVKVLMREIEEISGQETFEAKMAVLMENVEHHAEEEESELFSDVGDHMDNAQLTELGTRLEAAK